MLTSFLNEMVCVIYVLNDFSFHISFMKVKIHLKILKLSCLLGVVETTVAALSS